MKKQEGEVGEKPEEETLEQCMARVKAENPEMSDEEARAQCTKKPEPEGEAEKGLRNQILGVMKEYGDKLAADIRQDIETKMKQVVQETRDEMVQSLRKGLGLEKDPIVHLSEVEGMVRKIVLDDKPHGKRSETDTPDKPALGEPSEIAKSIVKPADDLFNDMIKKKGGL